MDDNTLFFNDAEQREEVESKYVTSPAAEYIEFLCPENRVNLMKSVNTLYRDGGSVDVSVDIDFDNV